MKNERYSYQKELGSGASGKVMLFKKDDTGQLIAVKKYELTSTNGAEEEFAREEEIMRSLDSEFIVKFIEASKNANYRYIKMEYSKESLAELLEKEKIKEDRMKKIMFSVLHALKYLHSKGIMHRDIKPENILVEGNKAKICDFGFSKRFREDLENSRTGTIYYLSPEMLSGSDYAYSNDIWAAGCVMAEIILGEPLFEGETEDEQIVNITEFFRGNSINDLKQGKFKEKFKNKVSKIGIDLLEKLLEPDRFKRISASDAVKHSFFKDKPKFKIVDDKENLKKSVKLSIFDLNKNSAQLKPTNPMKNSVIMPNKGKIKKIIFNQNPKGEEKTALKAFDVREYFRNTREDKAKTRVKSPFSLSQVKKSKEVTRYPNVFRSTKLASSVVRK